MDKDKFLTYVNNPAETSEKDMALFYELAERFPYCQISRMFIAKIAYDNNLPEKMQKLNQAAIYTTHRSVLKNVIEGWHTLPERPATANIEKETSQNPEPPAPDPANAPQEAGQMERPPGEAAPVDTAENISEPVSPPQETQANDPAETPDDEGRLAAQVLENLEKAKELREKLRNLDEFEIVASEDKKEKPEERPETTAPQKEEDLLQSLEAAEERPVDDRKKQQLEIIDNFINNEYLLTSRRYRHRQEAAEEVQEDLSLRSASMGDDLVSENLAVILEKQGKVDKAIDIYKKLIWKFPQKKAYFASQIEELKNR